MSVTQNHQQLPGFEALCQAIGQPGLALSEKFEPSPPATPVELFTEYPFVPGATGAQSQGWFNTQQDEVQRTLEALQPLNLDRDGLYRLAFEVDPERVLYEGEDLNKKAKLQKAKPSTSKARDSAEKHSKVEKRRRARHQGWQIQSHRMVGEFAHLCVLNDRVYLSKDDKDDNDIDTDSSKPKGNKSRNPKAGKDESFCGTIYSLSVCGIVLQSEHEGRKLAERQAEVLAERVADLERRLSKSSRLPLSPFASPTCSTASHHSLQTQCRL